MAKRGPRPQPTVKKILMGNPGRRPLPKREPKPRVPKGIPRAPMHLDKRAQKEWRRMAKELYPTGVMTVVDRTALEAYCSEYSKWIYATGQIQKHGMTVKAKSGYPIQSPFLSIANKAQSEMRKWLCEMGCTPSSRSRVEVVFDDKEDPLDAFQKKGKKLEIAK